MKPTKIYAEMIDSIALEQFENAMSLTCNVQGALIGYNGELGHQRQKHLDTLVGNIFRI